MNKESPQLSPSKKTVEVSDQSHPPHLRILLTSFGHLENKFTFSFLSRERPLYHIIAVFGFVFCVGAAITKERWREWGSRSWQEVRHLRYVALQASTQYTILLPHNN